MAVPGFQTMMLPILKLAADRNEHTLKEAADTVAQEFRMADQERRETVSPRGPTKLRNRVANAFNVLRRARLLDGAGSGRFRIAQRGLDVLAENPESISVKFLMRFPDFRPIPDAPPREGDPDRIKPVSEQTPEESLETSCQILRRQLAEDLLERVRKCSPAFFERLVVDLLVAMGYGGSRKDAGEAVGGTGDGGIDGIIKEDKLGLDAVYVQAKRWQNTVGRPAVQEFAGSLEGHRARKGVLITTSDFSGDARKYVERIEKRIVLIDGAQLAELMIDHGVGVTDVATYTVKRVDSDYFEEE